eukprot:CAMPEP_0174375610 /NCGR_PEP_ID=MMETSP0811_2-20130205/115259_1 /TAXON_ID=73025 ORGANISM="Eutreptiella gymnastica-like, Strain CCMP1594" /NCGR_SAMPLE_ID=MMETSP0811_2 /ASSEMBLY_ACC=CAM_ASM_000667 /LENGTH=72 /DNA_ID=CAMNT_0015526039 /DNA_START=172 /DNA_END=390 /DNA_ORIENTATION=+
MDFGYCSPDEKALSKSVELEQRPKLSKDLSPGPVPIGHVGAIQSFCKDVGLIVEGAAGVCCWGLTVEHDVAC